jgi:putative ABC transport system permease protein
VSVLLARSGLRYFARHRWHAVLSILGVALGVGVVFSIDLVNGSARRAFRLSTAAVVGKATHHVVGGPQGITDSVYTDLRVVGGARASAPVVEGYVGIEGIPGRAYRVLGVDPFAEPPFRDYLGGVRLRATPRLAEFLLTPGSTYVPRSLGTALDAVPGDTLRLRVAGRTRGIVVLGYFDDASSAGEGMANLLVMDVASAQEVLASVGRLDRIDLIIPGSASDELERLLPTGTELVRSQSRSRRIEDMSLAFTQNLLALSLLALVVGMFLIYNTMTFSVVRRRSLIGDLRTLGVTRREVFGLVLTEAAVVGATGTVLGLFFGRVLAHGLIGMVTQTINDFYFVVTVSEVNVASAAVVKAVALGVGATILSAIPPAREATATPPRAVQSRSAAESAVRERLPVITASGFVLLALGVVGLSIPTRSLPVAFGALLLLIAGFALLTPGAIVVALGRLPRAWQRRMGSISRMAVRGVSAQLSRSAVAIAALAIAVGTTVGVGTMVTSFRETVVRWLETTLDADVYVSAPSAVSRQSDAILDPEAVVTVSAMDGVVGVGTIRAFLGRTQHGVANVVALDIVEGTESRYHLIERERGAVWARFQTGEAALVSEPYASRHGVGPGDSVTVLTTTGRRSFAVAAVYRDYASDVGTVMIARNAYRRHWNDDGVTGVALYLAEPDSAAALVRRIERRAGGDGRVVARSNRALRQASIDIFDRTFAITNILRLVTVLVAFVGVLSALMALQLERSRELAVLRAIGLTPGQLWRLVTTQTGVMGCAAGLLALPFGTALAAILIFVVNKRSFGWTLEMSLGPGVLLQALAVAVVAALLAGVYPGYRMARTPPARALREE